MATRQVPALGRGAAAGGRNNPGNGSKQVPLSGGPPRAEGDLHLVPSLPPVQGGSEQMAGAATVWAQPVTCCVLQQRSDLDTHLPEYRELATSRDSIAERDRTS